MKPRPVTPINAPSETPDDKLEPIAKRAEYIRALAAAALACVLVGVTWATWNRDVVKTPQLEQVRIGASAQLAATSATTTAQLGALQATVQDLRTHQAALDTALHDLTDDMHFLRDQLVEVARATGARAVPQPKETTP